MSASTFTGTRARRSALSLLTAIVSTTITPPLPISQAASPTGSRRWGLATAIAWPSSSILGRHSRCPGTGPLGAVVRPESWSAWGLRLRSRALLLAQPCYDELDWRRRHAPQAHL